MLMSNPTCPVNTMPGTYVTPSGITADGDVWVDETRHDAASQSYYEYHRYLELGEYDAEAVNAILTKDSLDVFMCHNSEDKPEVCEIANRLRAAGLKPWLDDEQLRPGLSMVEELERAIDGVRAAAVFVGAGEWRGAVAEARARVQHDQLHRGL
jgi:TIR domain